jgi:hypothetical protein
MTQEQSVRVTAKGDFTQLQRGLKQLQGDLKTVTGEIDRGARKGGFFDDSQVRALDFFGKRFRRTLQDMRDALQEHGHAYERLLSQSQKAHGAEKQAFDKEIKNREQMIDKIEDQISSMEKLYRQRQREANEFDKKPAGGNKPSSGGGGGGGRPSEGSNGGGVMRGIWGMGKIALGMAGIGGMVSMAQQAYELARFRQVNTLDLAQRMRGQAGRSGTNTNMFDQATEVGRRDRMGYTQSETWGFLDEYSRTGGNINTNQQAGLMKFGRGYGLNTSEVAGNVAGNVAVGGGSPTAFADAIAGSIAESGMTPRILEVMQTNNSLLERMNTTLKDGSSKQILAYQTTLDKIGLDRGMTQLTGAQGANLIGGLGGIYQPGQDNWKWMGVRALQQYKPDKYGKMGLFDLEMNHEDGLMNPDNIPAMSQYVKGQAGGNKSLEKRIMQKWLTDGGYAATKREASDFYDATGGLSSFNEDQMAAMRNGSISSGDKYDAERKDLKGQGYMDTDARFEHAMEQIGRPIVSAVMTLKEGITTGLEGLLGILEGTDANVKGILDFLNKNLIGLGLDSTLLSLPIGLSSAISAILPNSERAGVQKAYSDLYGKEAPDWLTNQDQMDINSPSFFRKDSRWTGDKYQFPAGASEEEKSNQAGMYEYFAQQDAAYSKEQDNSAQVQRQDNQHKAYDDAPWYDTNKLGNNIGSLFKTITRGAGTVLKKAWQSGDAGDSDIGAFVDKGKKEITDFNKYNTDEFDAFRTNGINNFTNMELKTIQKMDAIGTVHWQKMNAIYEEHRGFKTMMYLMFQPVADYLKTMGGAGSGGNGQSYSGQYSDIIKQASGKYGIDANLIAAVIQTESGFDPNAESGAGAQGLMQLMPGTARGLGVNNSFDPTENIMGGSKHLSHLMDKYKGNKDYALKAYNWGEGNLDGWLAMGANPANMPKETQDYAGKVLGTYGQFTGSSASGSFFKGWQDKVTSRFGAKEGFRNKPHGGLDIDGIQGDKLDALAGGIIDFIKMDDGGSMDEDGKMNTRAGGSEVGVRMPDDSTYFYSHLSKVNPNLKKGSKLGAGDWVGNMGGDKGQAGSGSSTTGSHLHLGYMDQGGNLMNPEELLAGLNAGDSSIGKMTENGVPSEVGTKSEIKVSLDVTGAGAAALNKSTTSQLEALVRRIVAENEHLKQSMQPTKMGWN